MPSLNKPLILRLADTIEKSLIPELSFDMENYASFVEHPCNTTACMAGYTLILTGRVDSPNELLQLTFRPGGNGEIFNAAMSELGLTEDQASTLFFETTANDVQTVACLRSFVETDVIDWDMAYAQNGGRPIDEDEDEDEDDEEY